MSAHAVQFYEDESVFIESLSEFAGAALGSGGACVVIATQDHHRRLVEKLTSNNIDVTRTVAEGRYIPVDARRALERLLVQGRPDPQRFWEEMAPVIERARAALRPGVKAISVFGEMVAMLWAEGNQQGAIELEHLWNELVERYKLHFRCAYPIGSFAKESYSGGFDAICSQHSAVIPSESYSDLASGEERDRMVSTLQQKASAVDAVVEEREKEVAHRKVVEEKLRRTEEFTRNIIESSADCVKVLDLDGRIQYMSPAGQRSMEITDASQYLNKLWVELWREEDRSRAKEALSAAREGNVGSFQGDSITIGGLRKSWDVRITPALDRQGAIERLVAVSRDITELKSAQQLAIQSEKLAATGRLAATIAHEINNPLEAVTNFIYLAMTAQGLPEEVCRHLSIADRELARVSQIAQQTLGFYRGASKDRWINLADLIRDVLVVYERKLAYKRIETTVSVSPDLKLYGRQGELRQAVSNLLTNAIDASKAGGKIWIRARVSHGWNGEREAGVRITLADNGSGMPREVQKKIFIPFFTTKAEIGTGIGLWATKALIEQQGGALRFRSRQGEKSGTTMSIFLPNAHTGKASGNGD
ncbi:ATP-binding protein [Occallatibacter savannae]|uniref:ATP-binding protein n=1 Tax=Occallatibacter savannae TaxID=1002691 RepID=UPI0013A5B200|nr:ATP-binding protein [Occallatibacter savannae]